MKQKNKRKPSYRQEYIVYNFVHTNGNFIPSDKLQAKSLLSQTFKPAVQAREFKGGSWAC